MYLGHPPFKPKQFLGTSNQRMALMRKKILKGEPLELKSLPSGPRDLIARLLKKDARQRLSAAEIPNHPWIKVMG